MSGKVQRCSWMSSSPLKKLKSEKQLEGFSHLYRCWQTFSVSVWSDPNHEAVKRLWSAAEHKPAAEGWTLRWFSLNSAWFSRAGLHHGSESCADARLRTRQVNVGFLKALSSPLCSSLQRRSTDVFLKAQVSLQNKESCVSAVNMNQKVLVFLLHPLSGLSAH